MSRRVAIRKELAGAAGGAVAGRAAGMALGSVVPVIGTAIGGAVGGVLGAKLGDKATDKAGEMSSNQSFTDKIKERGKAAADAGAAYAQAQQASQHRMEERGRHMADKAKAGSQIATGEAMDMSWQMLKAWSFASGFDAFDKELVINHAKKRKLKHVSNHDLGHHDKRFNQRYKDNQEMPKGAEGLTPRDLALAYMDLMLQKNPELLNRANNKIQPRDKRLPDNFPGLTFPLLQTDEPIRSTYEEDDGKAMRAYQPVFAVGHAKHEPSEHPKVALITAHETPTGSKSRPHMPVTHIPNTYSHDFHDIADDAARQAFYEEGDVPAKLPTGVSQVARNKRIVAEEAQRRHEGDFMQPVDVERMRQQGLGRSMTNQVATQRVLSANPLAEPHLNPLFAFPQSELRQDYQQYLAQQQKQAEMPEIDTPSVQPSPIPGMVFFNGQLMREDEVPVQTGEPMDLAWRMLKGDLQLPHQITEALRDDLSTLDRAHKMTDTNEGTLIENIHPDMEQVVKLLAEKHLGEMSPSMSRPTTPLFHGPFH